MSIDIVLNSRQPRPLHDRVLVRGPAIEAPPPGLLDLLRALDLTPVVTQADDGFEPSSDSLRCAILVGTARDAAAADRRQLDAELEWVRATDRVGTPILGIGHGARVLACALGGGLERLGRGQRGWALVDTSVPHLIAAGPWITWQREAIRLPPAALSCSRAIAWGRRRSRWDGTSRCSFTPRRRMTRPPPGCPVTPTRSATTKRSP